VAYLLGRNRLGVAPSCSTLSATLLATVHSTHGHVYSYSTAITIGATTLWDPSDASPPTSESVGTKCILVPSNFCDWLSFLLASTLFNV